MYNNKLLIRTYTGTYTEIFLYACCTHKNCRFGEVSFLAPVYKSSRISATQQPIRNKFGTNVEKGRLVRNPQKNWKFVLPIYGPFPRGRSHILIDIKSRYMDPKINELLDTACFLDPRFKVDHICSENVDSIKTRIRDEGVRKLHHVPDSKSIAIYTSRPRRNRSSATTTTEEEEACQNLEEKEG